MSDPTWLFARETAQFQRQRASTLRWWQDGASGRIDGRFLGEHERRSAEAVQSLQGQADAVAAADRATRLVDDAIQSAREALDQTGRSLESAAAELQTANEFADVAQETGMRAEESLLEALDLVGSAGASCGEATQGAAQLREGIRERLPDADPRVDAFLHGAGELGDGIGEPLELVAHRFAGSYAGAVVGIGAAALPLAEALRPLMKRGPEGDAMRRQAWRVHRRFRTRLVRTLQGR